MPEEPRGAVRIVGAALFALFLLLYLWTFPLGSDGIVLGSDVTWYARDLARGDHWHPHHLLYHLTAALLLRVREWALPDEGPVYAALAAQRWLAAASGAGIVALAYAFAARRLGALRGALIAGVLGLSTGTWFYAAVGEVQTPAHLWTAALLVLAAVERLEGRLRPAWWHALLLLVASLVRQDGILVVPAYLVLVAPRRGVAVVAAAGAASLALYLVAWRLAAPPSGFADWMHRIAADGTWNAGGWLWSVRTALFGTAAALVYVPALDKVSPWAALALATLACALAVGRRRPGEARAGDERAGDEQNGDAAARRVAAALALFAALRFAFYTWWQPTNPEFHGATWIPLLLLLALALDRERAARRQAALLALALVATGVGTARVTILPHRGDAARERALEAIAAAGPGGVVLALDWVQDWALMREAPADVVVQRAIPQAIDAARARIAAAHARGGRALLARDDRLGPRILGATIPPPPGLIPALAQGYEIVPVGLDASDPPWLVELVAP